MAEEEQVEDYMSLEIVETETNRIKTYSEMRREQSRAAERKNQLNSQHTRIDRENLRRKEGLQTPISSDNKGFQLLSKMGYIPPMNNDNLSSLLVDNLMVPKRRAGLGAAEQQIVQNEPSFVNNCSEIVTFASQSFHRRRISKYFHQAIAVCEQLDNKHSDSSHVRCQWLLSDTARNENDTDVNEEKKLNSICEYLRSTHNYCLFCGIQFHDLQDINENCPGASYAAH